MISLSYTLCRLCFLQRSFECSPTEEERPPTVMSEPDSEERRTAQIITPEQELQSESDQGCDPATPAAEGMQVEVNTEDWLIELNMEVLTPTLSYLVFPPLRLQQVPPSLRVCLGPQSHRLCLNPWPLWLRLRCLSSWLH